MAMHAASKNADNPGFNNKIKQRQLRHVWYQTCKNKQAVHWKEDWWGYVFPALLKTLTQGEAAELSDLLPEAGNDGRQRFWAAVENHQQPESISLTELRNEFEDGPLILQIRALLVGNESAPIIHLYDNPHVARCKECTYQSDQSVRLVQSKSACVGSGLYFTICRDVLEIVIGPYWI